MKTVPYYFLSTLSLFLLLSSCQKEELHPAVDLNNTAVLSATSISTTEFAAVQALDIKPFDEISLEDQASFEIVAYSYPCSRTGTTLFVFLKLADDLLAEIDLNRYTIEWYNVENKYLIIADTDTVHCMFENENYLAVVKDKRTDETAYVSISI